MREKINVVFIPHKGEQRLRDGSQWERGMRWGSDFMLQHTIDLADPRFNITPRFNFNFSDFGGIDLVHLHNIATTALRRNMFLQRDSNIRRYANIENPPKIIGGIRGEVGFLRAKGFLKYFDGVHVSNKRLYNRVSKVNHNVYLLYPGVDMDLFKFLGEPAEFCIGWAGDKDKTMKNFHLLKELGYHLVTATKENYIPHERMPEFYNSCSVYVYLSTHEGCNRTILEAASCARPIVSSDAGAVREILDDEWIVKTPPSDKRRFISEVNKRIEAFRSSPELRREVGMRNRHRIKRWDWHEIIKNIEEMWLDVLQKG